MPLVQLPNPTRETRARLSNIGRYKGAPTIASISTRRSRARASGGIDCIQDTRFSPLPSSLPLRHIAGKLRPVIVRSACIINSHMKGVSHMHSAAQNLRGGVSPRSTRLRGQSIIEYVLIIAVIGLVIVFAGPGVAGAIRNQFNQVTNTVDPAPTAITSSRPRRRPTARR